jgi:hypothetical protein
MLRPMTEPTTIREAGDVTPECLTAAEEVFEGFFDNDGEPIDWYSFFDRLERYGYCSNEVDNPAVRKIQRHIRKFRQDS